MSNVSRPNTSIHNHLITQHHAAYSALHSRYQRSYHALPQCFTITVIMSITGHERHCGFVVAWRVSLIRWFITGDYVAASKHNICQWFRSSHPSAIVRDVSVSTVGRSLTPVSQTGERHLWAAINPQWAGEDRVGSHSCWPAVNQPLGVSCFSTPQDECDQPWTSADFGSYKLFCGYGLKICLSWY